MRSINHSKLLPALVILLPALAFARFPSNPTSLSDCDAAAAQYRALYQQHQQLASQGITDSNRLQLSRDCAGNEHCRAQYYHRKGEYHKFITHHQQERDRIRREWDAGERSCRMMAQTHEQQNEAQRRNRQAYEENQRRQNAAQLQAYNQQQERNQPRVIATTPPGYYDNRNTPRVVQSPQQQAYQAQEQRNAAISQQQAQTEALATVFGSLARVLTRPSTSTTSPAVSGNSYAPGGNAAALAATPSSSGPSASPDAQAIDTQATNIQDSQVAQAIRSGWTQLRNMAAAIFSPPDPGKPAGPQLDVANGLAYENNTARREMLDSALNPGGVRNPDLDNTTQIVQDMNQQMNRGGSLVTQIQNDAYSAINSTNNNTLGQLDQGLAQIEQIRTDPGNADTTTRQQVAMIDPPASGNTSEAPASPEANCGRRVLFARQQCLQRECEKAEFKSHAQCLALNEPRRND